MATETPGVKVIELVTKHPDISDERFHYHWGVLHPRVSHRVEPMERYVQHHRIAPGLPGFPSLDVPGITEAWFASMDAANSGFEHPVFVEEGLPSMRRFMDLDRSTWLFTTEEVVVDDVDEGHSSARLVLELRRAPGTSEAEFAAALRAHADVAAAVPGVRRLAQFFPLPGANTLPDNYDGVELLAFDDLEVLEEAWAGPAVQDALLGDLATFCDIERSGLLVGHAIRVK